MTTILSYSQYATLTECRVFIDLNKYPFAEELMKELKCKSTRIFVGYDKKHPKNIVEFDISKLFQAQNKDNRRDTMKGGMIYLNNSFCISSLLINYAVHKKRDGEDIYFLVTLDSNQYRISKELFVEAVKNINVPVYKQFRKSDDYPRGATYVRYNSIS